MSNAVLVMPFVSTASGLPVVPEEDLVPFADYEVNAREHWIFGGGEQSLVGVVNGSPLTPQGSAHTFTATSVQVPGFGGALVSPFPDDVISRTFAAVVKRPVQGTDTSKMGVYWGNRAGSAGGLMFYAYVLSSGGAVSTSASTVSGTRNAGTVRYNDAGVSDGEWAFILFSETESDFVSQINGVQESGDLDRPRTLSVNNWALGNAYYNTTNYRELPLEFAEWIAFDNAMTAPEAMAAYQRAKARCARRGITIA